MHKYPTSFQAVDGVIIHREEDKILLSRKPKENLFRFMGGFVDPTDTSLESAVIREKCEENGLGLECSTPEYLFSFRVPDPRYVDSQDKIMSAVFRMYYLFGLPKAGDDIFEVRWYKRGYIHTNYKTIIMPVHHPLVEGLIQRGVL